MRWPRVWLRWWYGQGDQRQLRAGVRVWAWGHTAALEINRDVYFSELYGYQKVHRFGVFSVCWHKLPG